MADYAAITAALFAKYDADGSGTLNAEDTRPFFDELIAARADLGLTGDNYTAWFGNIDKDADGTISQAELAEYLASINYTA